MGNQNQFENTVGNRNNDTKLQILRHVATELKLSVKQDIKEEKL